MTSDRARFAAFAVLAVVGVMVFASAAHAQATPTAEYEGLLDLIKNNANNWATQLRGYATRLFWLLAIIQMVWTFFPLVLKQADFGEIVGELVRFILTIGFFYALLLYSVTWGTAVVESFRTAGGVAGGFGKEIMPGDMFEFAVDMAKTVGDVSTWNPITATMVAIGAAIVLLCFAFIAAFMGVTLVESYIVINASVLFMGFGGSQWTREYAIAMARYAVAVGAKLFILTLLVGIILQSAHQWQAAYNHDQASMWTMVGLSLVAAYLAKQIPDLVQSLITGTSLGGGAALGGFAAAAAAGATAGIAAAATGGLGGAAAAAGNAAGTTGSTAASGGLAGAIDASMSGAGNMARGATGGMNGSGGGMGGASSLSPRVGGGASASPRNGQSSATPRTGGGAAGQGGPSAPKAAGSSARATSSASGAAQQGASAASTGGGEGGQGSGSQAPQGGATAAPQGTAPQEPGQSSPSPDTSTGTPNGGPAEAGQAGGAGASEDNVSAPETGGRSGPGAGHRTAAGVVRAMGMLSAISVPGMEGAAGLSIGPHPGQFGGAPGSGGNGQPPAAGGDAESKGFESGDDNTIRPASPAPAPEPPATKPASQPPKPPSGGEDNS